MNKRLAYIDYTTNGSLMTFELAERGIEIAGAVSLADFLTRNKIEDYSFLLYHPGVEEQHRIREMREKYPKLNIAIVTISTSGADYLNSDFRIFAYNSIDAIENWMREK